METVGAAIYVSLFPMDTVADAPMAQRYVKTVTPAERVCLFFFNGYLYYKNLSLVYNAQLKGLRHGILSYFEHRHNYR